MKDKSYSELGLGHGYIRIKQFRDDIETKPILNDRHNLKYAPIKLLSGIPFREDDMGYCHELKHLEFMVFEFDNGGEFLNFPMVRAEMTFNYPGTNYMTITIPKAVVFNEERVVSLHVEKFVGKHFIYLNNFPEHLMNFAMAQMQGDCKGV